MVKVLIALCILAAVQVSSAFQEKVPIFRQPYIHGDATKIVGGQTATRGQFPHQAGIFLDGNKSFCGGSLISKNWVLTAAHCIFKYRIWDVVLGAQNIRESEPGRVAVRSTEAISHQWHSELSNWHDIGIIRLPQEVEISDYIKIIRLPPRSLQPENLAGKSVFVSGWGFTSDSSEDISPTLQFVDLTVITREECRKTFGSIPDYQFCCSGENGKSPCSGDSGSALTIGSGPDLVQIGIASYVVVYGCSEGYPMGFTSVSYYVDWIYNKTGIPVQE